MTKKGPGPPLRSPPPGSAPEPTLEPGRLSRPIHLEQIDANRWRIPRDEHRGMRVDGIIFADERLIAPLRTDPALEQVANVATLPGIVGASLAMPDVHWGYGFPIGGVAAMHADGGVVSPGGIGFDINCGVRLLRSDLVASEIRPRLEPLADALFAAIPSGVGARPGQRLALHDLDEVMCKGARWAVERGFGWSSDLDRTEERGEMVGAIPGDVSHRAHERGADQLGTLGSGNHFIEVQVVDRVLEPSAATALGLEVGAVTVMIHCGSRGLGHQVCTDHLTSMDTAAARAGIVLPDRQLACAPLGSPEANAYLAAMAAAANFAWANRQLIGQAVRAAFERVFSTPAVRLGLELVYDLSHNVAKIEQHHVAGQRIALCVHRKGATRAFPPGHPDVPAEYRAIGQPVLIPGDMGRCSYVAVGAPGAMELTFGSSCHGAGRSLSRHAAVRLLRGVDVAKQLGAQGIVVRAERRDLLAEEASPAYKDVEIVVEVSANAGLIRPVARLRPLIVVKG